MNYVANQGVVASNIVREMANDAADDEIVSRFFLDTCELGIKLGLNTRAILALVVCAETLSRPTQCDPETQVDIPSTTGSVGEFYIDPMLSCVGDYDIMYYHSTKLAIPAGHLPPTQLPAEFSSYVVVVEIMDSEYPGYVYYLVKSYLLIECEDDGKYYGIPVCLLQFEVEPQYVKHDDVYPNPITGAITHQYIHGPAVSVQLAKYPLSSDKKNVTGLVQFSDHVPSRRCLSWPPQAADWPTRSRN